MNCAHLENCLHEAREEARTNKCSADRRAVEYDALRSSALRIHGLFERLNNCVTAPSMSCFAESLHSLAVSLARYVFLSFTFIYICAIGRGSMCQLLYFSWFFLQRLEG